MGKIKVKAREGLKVFFPVKTYPAPGRRNFVLTGDETIEVNGNDLFVQKQLRIGDLIVVRRQKVSPAPSATPEEKPTKRRSKERSTKGSDE